MPEEKNEQEKPEEKQEEKKELTEVEKLQAELAALKKLMPPAKGMANIVELTIIQDGVRFAFHIPNGAPFSAAHTALSKLSAIVTAQEENAENLEAMKKRMQEAEEKKAAEEAAKDKEYEEAEDMPEAPVEEAMPEPTTDESVEATQPEI